MSRVCSFDIDETLRDLWARIPHFERIVSDSGRHRSRFSQLLQPVPVVMAVDAYPDSGRSAALSWG
jgi:hypothetical protein